MPYIDKDTLKNALLDLKDTATPELKYWLTLKHMGLTENQYVDVDTNNGVGSYERLFGYGPGAEIEAYYIPFAGTPFRHRDSLGAARSNFQSTLRKWRFGQMGGTDPRGYLEFEQQPNKKWRVKTRHRYPEGLGYSKNGFAPEAGTRLAVPLVAFSVWFYRQAQLPADVTNWVEYFTHQLCADLKLSSAEQALVFSSDPQSWSIQTQPTCLTNMEVYDTVEEVRAMKPPRRRPQKQERPKYIEEVRALTGRPNLQALTDPEKLLLRLLDAGTKAVLLYGPPRTGKTRAVLQHTGGKDLKRIQLHDGWGYDELIVGLRPPLAKANDNEGDNRDAWTFKSGALWQAIKDGKKYIILEEINRTEIAQAFGEAFSLIEDTYRGEDEGVDLPNNERFYIPKDVVILMTMNNLDRTTEAIDDALLGRIAAIEFPPSPDALRAMLDERGVEDVERWITVFDLIQNKNYPLGHGYFASLRPEVPPLDFYQTRIRPVLQKHFQGYRDDDLKEIDDLVEEQFSQAEGEEIQEDMLDNEHGSED